MNTPKRDSFPDPVDFIDAYAAPTAFINGLISEFAEHYPEEIKQTLTHFEKFTAYMQIWYQKKKPSIFKININ